MTFRSTLLAALLGLSFCAPTIAAAEGCGDLRPQSDYWCAFVFVQHWDNGFYRQCPDGSSILWRDPIHPLRDQDGDCIPDCLDPCPNDPEKNDVTGPGCCGCGQSDVDLDGDGWPACYDECPTDVNKTTPGECGCGVPDIDSDGDGALDCHDICKNDSKKTTPGICGCGVSEVDTDGDGTLDCQDKCPTDSTKTDPGICGCGRPDEDSDNDGSKDCQDDCLGGVIDKCGVCNGKDECVDCNGVPNGDHVLDKNNQCCLPGAQDECDICAGDGSSCKFCFTTNISVTIESVKTRLSEQVAFLNRLIRTLSQSNCGLTKLGKRLQKQSRVKSGRISSASVKSLSLIPETISSCEPCDDINNSSSISSYQEQANEILSLSSKVIEGRLSCSLVRGGKCRGPIKECVRRVKSRISLQRVDLNRARKLFNSTLTSLKKVPSVTQRCE